MSNLSHTMILQQNLITDTYFPQSYPQNMWAKFVVQMLKSVSIL